MATLSIVIPALGGTNRLEESLVSVLQNRPVDAEVLVVLGESYGDPYSLAGEVRFIKPRNASLASCLAAGLAASSAPVVHLLASGMEARPGWCDAALRHFSNTNVAAVSPLLREADGRVTAGVSRSSSEVRSTVDPAAAAAQRVVFGPELRAAFYRKETLESLRMTSQLGSQLADVELALAINLIGARTVFEPRCEVRATTSFASNAVRGFASGRDSERLYRRYPSEDPQVRATHRRGVLLDLAPTPARWASLAGRVLAALQSPMHKRFRQRVEYLATLAQANDVDRSIVSFEGAQRSAVRETASTTRMRKAS